MLPISFMVLNLQREQIFQNIILMLIHFEVTRDGKHVGILMIDNYPRPSKRGGAWCGAFRSQSRDINGNMIYPIGDNGNKLNTSNR